jgi:hypothetical protein
VAGGRAEGAAPPGGWPRPREAAAGKAPPSGWPRPREAAGGKASPGGWPLPREDARHRILILGDSLATRDFGGALERRLDAHAKLDARRRAKSSTGLARPDYFDWMAEGARLLERHDPDLVVVIIGGNDGQDLIAETARPRRVRWRAPAWRDAYAARVTAFLDLLTTSPRARVLWLALPVMDLRHFERKLTVIREVQRAAVEAHPKATYLDTRAWSATSSGTPLREVVMGGRRVPLRQEDGVHFSRPGGAWFAAQVAPEVLERFPDPGPRADRRRGQR